MLIGLSVNHKEGLSCIADAYVEAIVKAGGSPLLIPLTGDSAALDEALSQVDGLILSGGGDIDAPLYGETPHPAATSSDPARDRYDIRLAQRAVEKQIPVLGICRGVQVINVAFGGSLIQDIPSQMPESAVNHNQPDGGEMHSVALRAGSTLHRLMKADRIPVNSFHHQAIRTVAPGFEAVAQSEDGVIEAIESADGRFILGVQWHPERMLSGDQPLMLSLFRRMIAEAGCYRKVKDIHRRIYTIDSHCDTPLFFPYGIDIGKANPPFELKPAPADGMPPVYQLKVDVPKMQDGLLDAVFMAAYLRQGERDAAASAQAAEKALDILRELIRQVEKNNSVAGIARTTADLKRLKAEGRKAIFLGVENGYAIGKDLRNLQRFADKGVKYITLSHNGDNDLCDAAVGGRSEHNGLSDFGKEVVKEMNRLRILVDLSHTSEKTSFDALALSRHPVIASHSSAKALCNHPRNLSDSLIRAIAATGGVVQVCLYSPFLKESGTATVKDAVDHIDHIARIAGTDYAGIGSDFDGGGELSGVKAANEMPQITLELLRRGYSEADIAKIWGGNLMRVMDHLNK
ncbi:MAG: membrane dipeptidase [Dysgonamonadaceae bacterium]|jgi:microsomal dipeptidase-like Zn-dependent dipeptidase/gamma-glutamyl-gamma-aminobutyrate hydrolase PuuD|nr:membrane dipeptidase [Dysgonamonadaceae bacterium]